MNKNARLIFYIRVALIIIPAFFELYTSIKNDIYFNKRMRTVRLKRINDHCSGPKDVRWVINADKGWKIDASSIKLKATSVSKRSNFEGVTDATQDSFVIVGRIVNYGDCIWPFKDARGSLVVQGTYQEYKFGISRSR